MIPRFSLIERRTPLKRGKPPARSTKPINRGKPPRRVSEKRRKQLIEYKDIRAVVLARDGGCVLWKIDPVKCVFLNAMHPMGHDLEIEHANGRRGQRLVDETGCVSLHRACHMYVTDHAKEWKPKLRNYLAGLYGNG